MARYDPSEPRHTCPLIDSLIKHVINSDATGDEQNQIVGEAEEIRKANEALRGWGQNWRDDCETAREERDAAQQEASDMKDELDDARRELADAQRQIERLESSIEKLEATP